MRVGRLMQNPYLVGSGVYLRPIDHGDAPAVLPWMNDPEITRTLRLYRPMSLRAAEDFIARANQAEDQMVLGIVVKKTDRLVGVAGLSEIDARHRHAGFTMLIGVRQEWGQGYGTEATGLLVRHAFETLNLNRVWLKVFGDHAAALRIYEKARLQARRRVATPSASLRRARRRSGRTAARVDRGRRLGSRAPTPPLRSERGAGRGRSIARRNRRSRA
jgi:RimJ/RimL family protein N-acetyltransferase